MNDSFARFGLSRTRFLGIAGIDAVAYFFAPMSRAPSQNSPILEARPEFEGAELSSGRLANIPASFGTAPFKHTQHHLPDRRTI